MSDFIRAEVLTNSSDDKYFRVRIKSEGFFDESDLVSSVNCVPLTKGDIVIVDLSQGIQNPIIVGKWFDATVKTKSTLSKGQVLFQSADSSDWVVTAVNPKTLKLENSNGMVIEISDKIVINGGSLGGLINIAQLTAKLNSFVTVFNAHTHPDKGVKPAVETSPFSASDYEDSKVKH